jgi:hypothetical protein
MNRLLIDEYPLVVLPNLAQKVGLNEAIVLQQIHYWILQKKKQSRKNQNSFRDGHFWIRNTYEEWQQQFPFWSVPTIKRIFLSLESKELVFYEMFEKSIGNKRKWYRINYENPTLSDPSYQNDPMPPIGSNCADGGINLRPSYKEAETTGGGEKNTPKKSRAPQRAKPVKASAKAEKTSFKKRSLENATYDLEDVEEKRKVARTVRLRGKSATRQAMQRGEL